MWRPIRDHVVDGLGPEEWLAAKRRLPLGTRVVGEVLACLPMGCWITLGAGLVGQIEAPHLVDQDDPRGIDGWPVVGSSIAALVVDHSDERRRFRLTARSSDVFERVHIENSRYDGPLTGVADVEGSAHYFSRVFDAESDDWEAAIFHVWPIDPYVFDLEVEAWRIFVAWNDLFESGETGLQTHPGNQGINPRYDELQRQLSGSRLVPNNAARRLAHWQPIDRNVRYANTGPDYRVAWITDTTET